MLEYTTSILALHNKKRQSNSLCELISRVCSNSWEIKGWGKGRFSTLQCPFLFREIISHLLPCIFFPLMHCFCSSFHHTQTSYFCSHIRIALFIEGDNRLISQYLVQCNSGDWINRVELTCSKAPAMVTALQSPNLLAVHFRVN